MTLKKEIEGIMNENKIYESKLHNSSLRIMAVDIILIRIKKNIDLAQLEVFFNSSNQHRRNIFTKVLKRLQERHEKITNYLHEIKKA
jgi:hypothetical protein